MGKKEQGRGVSKAPEGRATKQEDASGREFGVHGKHGQQSNPQGWMEKSGGVQGRQVSRNINTKRRDRQQRARVNPWRQARGSGQIPLHTWWHEENK